MRHSFIALLASAAALAAQPVSYDLLLKNGRVVDGTGSAWFTADVAIRGDAIAAIAPRIDAPAARVIDVAGRIVAPGFIDIHTHARSGLSQVPTAPNYVRQGVTTVIEGPDGSSPLPLAPFLAQLARLEKSVNIGTFVGQGTVRTSVIGSVKRKATTFTPTEEVIELAKAAGRLGGVHASHQRDEAAKLLDSVRETIAIGETGGLPTQISHAKVVGVPNWGRSVDMLRLVDRTSTRRASRTSSSTVRSFSRMAG